MFVVLKKSIEQILKELLDTGSKIGLDAAKTAAKK